ncbi:unnamed protein product [Ixodes hexagonus]
MTSLIAEILIPKEPLERTNIKAIVSKLSRTVDDLKVDVQKELVSRYDTFQPYYHDSKHLAVCLDSAVKEVDSVLKDVHDHVKPRLAQSTSEFEFLTRELESLELQSVEVKRYARLHDLLESAEAEFAAENLLKCSQLLQDVASVIDELEGGPDVKMVEVLHTEQVIRCERLIYKLSEVWKRYVVWKVGKTPYVTELTISTTGDESTEAFALLLKALQQQNQLRDKVTKLGRALLSDVITPMVKYDTRITTEPKSPTLRMDFDESKAPSITNALQNLSTVFSFLTNRLPYRASAGMDLFEMLGEAVGKQFSDIVVECCLEPAVPSEASGLHSFPSNILLNLHNQLVDINFLSASKTPFSNFTSDLESLCISKRSQTILLKARELMRGKLHETVAVGEPAVTEKTKQAALDDGLDTSLFKFPRCQVSKFTEELVELLKTTLENMQEGSEGPTPQTWHLGTVRDICELYSGIVPLYHQHAIETIPLQTAVHHNNCMYLAHQLLELTAKASGPTLVDLALKLRHLAVVPFLEQMKRQKQYLLEFLQEAPVSEDSGDLERALKRCLFHLQQLKRAWSEVLPVSVYLKAVGTLLNSVLEHVIDSIFSMEDISSTLSQDLASVFEKAIEQAVDIFDVPDNPLDTRVAAPNHVAKWKKFSEMKSLFGFSLREVVDRWADGKGPLAICFTPDELKKLIRALFQNTDWRAAALAKIR